MQTQNRLLDELAKLVSNAAGAAQGVKAEIDGLVRQRAERWLADLDLAPREEFEAVKAMAALAREQNILLEARIAALEAQLAAPAKPARPRKSASRKGSPA